MFIYVTTKLALWLPDQARFYLNVSLSFQVIELGMLLHASLPHNKECNLTSENCFLPRRNEKLLWILDVIYYEIQ